MNDNRRTWEILAGLALLVVGFGSLDSGWVLALAMLLIGGGLLIGRRNISNSMGMPRRADDADVEYDDETPEPNRQSGAEKVYGHALRAVQRAGLNPDELRVLPVDIGVMVFKGDQELQVYRAQPVPDDADYIQPFVQLRLPTKAAGRIKFEIVDSDGQKIFVHEDIHQLERGRNLISPSARLPVHDAQAMHKDWQLRVSADGVLLATHMFVWEESESKIVRRHLTEDGEISNEMRAALAENRLGKMSLDELLDSQSEETPPEKQRRRN